MTPVLFDEIGYWSEVKLEIVREYAARYSTILSRVVLPGWCQPSVIDDPA